MSVRRFQNPSEPAFEAMAAVRSGARATVARRPLATRAARHSCCVLIQRSVAVVGMVVGLLYVMSCVCYLSPQAPYVLAVELCGADVLVIKYGPAEV